MPTIYDSEKYMQAVTRFLDEPKTLTDEDIAQIELVDQAYGAKAKAGRAGYVAAEEELPPEVKRIADSAVTWKRLWRLLAHTKQADEMLLASYRYRIRNLAARLEALESRPSGVKWCGVFSAGDSYSSGSLVTRSGGLWLATETTTTTPGTHPAAWRLVVKEGRAPE